MITKAKVGIFKHKMFNTQKALSLEIPSSVAEAMTDLKWKQGM